jgi:beta-N-acetylhexosaminidase
MERSTLGQILLVGLPGSELNSDTARTLRNVQPGGFILFGRNIRSATQLRKLIDDLRDLSKIDPIITIDQEGGRVSRLKLIANEPPNAQQIREKNDLALASRHGRLTGEILRIFGFNLDLCPVLDISFDDNADNSLRGRCYGTSVDQVTQFAGAFNSALLKTGIMSCGKHFPGYAAATLDPHHDLPRIDRTRRELDDTELAIFRDFSRRVSSMMVCHAWYPAFDEVKTPASLSKSIVTDLLVTEMAFEGLIMTDDLDMGAITNEIGFADAIERSIVVGNHVAMICHRTQLAEEALVALQRAPFAPLDRFRALNQEIWELRVATLGLEKASERSPDDGKRSPVEMY